MTLGTRPMDCTRSEHNQRNGSVPSERLECSTNKGDLRWTRSDRLSSQKLVALLNDENGGLEPLETVSN